LKNTLFKKSSTKEKALVLGVNGQDGSYLADHLLSRGYLVVGVGRQAESKWVPSHPSFSYISANLEDITQFDWLIRKVKPDSVYHFAAIHGSAGFKYENYWKDAHHVNTIITHSILEYARKRSVNSFKLIYASSTKAFSPARKVQISESSERQSTCIYSITKNAATDLIFYYRKNHNINSTVIWLANHESPRRSGSFFIPRVVNILASSLRNNSHQETVRDLDFWCDWGSASEYMSIVIDIAEKAIGNDFVLATGEAKWAADFVKDLFLKYGLNASNHIIQSNKSNTAKDSFINIDVSHLRNIIERSPSDDLYKVCEEILRVNHRVD
jgi:GDPmannose 4,6-dehydratase